MERGTIVFHNDYHIFDAILNSLNVSEKSLGLSDSEFVSIYNYPRQELFHRLFNANHLWSYVCKEINKRDGSIGYKILNSNNNVNNLDAKDIYFALTMDDWSFAHWTEMNDIKNLSMSKGGNWIMKKPSYSTRNTAEKIILNFSKMGRPKDMLFGIVSCKDGPKYPNSHPLNSQWDKYSPYYPKHDATFGQQKSPSIYASPKSGHYSWTGVYDKPQGFWGSKSTLHAVPFLRDNIKPTTFSVAIPPKSYADRICMFINFPNGLPFRIQ